ncbi:MAG: hypothetical protein WD628_05840, partial [Thermomicrobiales bacterium]
QIDVSSDDSTGTALTAAAGRMKKKVQAGIDAVRQGIPLVVFGDANVERPITAAMNGQGTNFHAGHVLSPTR